MRYIFPLAISASFLLSACLGDAEDKSLTYYNCGETPVKSVATPDGVILSIDGTSHTLARTADDEGDKFVNAPDTSPAIAFIPQGDVAILDIDDDERPLCRLVQWRNGQDAEFYRAFGNEPAWFVEMTPEIVQIKRGYDGKPEIFSRSKASLKRAQRSYTLRDGVTLRIEHTPQSEPCRDTMSGQYFADKVTLTYGDERFEGCGDPAPFVETDVPDIQGTKWQVEDLDGRGVIDNAKLDVLMDADGTISGYTGCNRFSGSYKLTGRTLDISDQLVMTQRGCAPAISEQERLFADLLPAIQQAAFQQDGALILFAPDGRSLLLRADY